jgi:hypothetical protein
MIEMHALTHLTSAVITPGLMALPCTFDLIAVLVHVIPYE